MAYVEQEDANTFKGLVRCMCFSTDTVEMFSSSAAAGQIGAVNSMICHERMVRESRRRERLVRKARFPQIKSFNGCDFTQIALSEDYSVGDLKSLSFIDSHFHFLKARRQRPLRHSRIHVNRCLRRIHLSLSLEFVLLPLESTYFHNLSM